MQALKYFYFLDKLSKKPDNKTKKMICWLSYIDRPITNCLYLTLTIFIVINV